MPVGPVHHRRNRESPPQIIHFMNHFFLRSATMDYVID
jgi:hypothetical protein